MNNITRGIVAGLVATIVLSILMVLKGMMGLMPEVNAIAMLSGMAEARAGMPGTPVTGWILHFLIGAVLWGGLFAILNDKIPGGTQIVKGIVFSFIAWLLMMIVVMPMAGAGVFGLNIGMQAAVATLVLHIIFGAALGWMYNRLDSGGSAPAAPDQPM